MCGFAGVRLKLRNKLSISERYEGVETGKARRYLMGNSSGRGVPAVRRPRRKLVFKEAPGSGHWPLLSEKEKSRL